MKRIAALVAFLLLMAVSPAGAARPGYAWHGTNTGTTAHFRGLAAVSATTAWVSGYTPTDGVVMRTTDRGATWQEVTPPGAAGVQFRDIEAFDADNAVAMSIGDNPTDFRIYVTQDGGQSLGPHLREFRAHSLLRLHVVLQSQAGAGDLGSAGRSALPGDRHQRRWHELARHGAPNACRTRRLWICR